LSTMARKGPANTLKFRVRISYPTSS
jgi:hypothetical protein